MRPIVSPWPPPCAQVRDQNRTHSAGAESAEKGKLWWRIFAPRLIFNFGANSNWNAVALKDG